MLLVQLMKPFYTKQEGNRIKLVFAYQYFSIRKDDELFHFIPVEGKEIIVNAETLQVENLAEIFVFQKGNRYIRLPLYQLLVVSDVHKHLQAIIETNVHMNLSSSSLENAATVIQELEEKNYERMIDYALLHRDVSLFNKLQQYKEFNGGFPIE
ncbi:transcriptional regulator [Psychrobacillus sp. NEAU-3TGS]|uniref:transcriptional regulator n=1 Tax=Psychrobacillus sp. NEAU-3TGS TaxID=2995412 RepID=UPI002497DC10|nr:transcriptional regulator [Psychrobacillus sp. NEAU-3TGS]MDI2587728.1 transcriptional regulator [Psychrobacillus sp. NEAU-3TGS]